MEDLKLTVKALASMCNMSITELATRCDIDPVHLQRVSTGQVTMTATDIVNLSEYTGVPCKNIAHDKTDKFF